MSVNPCAECAHYDPILRGTHEARHGRCAVKSIYPTREQAGQSFPPGVKRAVAGALAEPVIVIGVETVKTCMVFRALPPAIATPKRVRR